MRSLASNSNQLLPRRALLLGAALAIALPTARAADFQEIAWDELVPKDWDPMKSMRDMQQQIGGLPDSDARVQKMYERMREVWDNAPAVAAMGGRAVKLPGYLVPLDTDTEGMREFLLVPYFGACIHTPPPPANQIIHVRSSTPIKGFKTMDAVWVSGTLKVQRSDSQMGTSGYGLAASQVAKYSTK
jgi:hypothetical protein